MPSVTVVDSSDTDIYIAPGLYGDCLPTCPTGRAADSFRAERILRVSLHARTWAAERTSPCGRVAAAVAGIHVTSTLWPSSK
ncbi:hypothetical protein FNH08_20160 [Streptomyces spongiae]|uniref:Uncharacterized protein n=1 Tax=Streptomyces spongiae TaxID=565072 RepID=A0A5N8XLB3_9ACTN|nr:hypothetical protein [Streptomyces spongiae]